MGVTKKKFEFRRRDGSMLGHGEFMRNRVENMRTSGQLDNVPTTRKPFSERFGDLSRLRASD